MALLAEQLRQAASAGQADKIRELLKSGAKIDPDLEGRTAVHRASANGHPASVRALLDFGAKVNSRDAAGYTPLHQAATEGHQEVVELLLNNGCHVDAQDELHGNTPLHEAAWKGFSRTVETLCRHKANVYIKNNGGFTPLHLTCQNGHNQSCRILLLSACKPDVRNSYGDTPLHTAARYGHAGVLRILISAFCSVNEVNKNGDTALHISSAMGKRKLTKILMEAGCDQKIKNNQSETSRDIAQRKGFEEVIAILDNPPVTLIPVVDSEKKDETKGKKNSKKREKDSATSQDSSSKEKKKDKQRKSKKKQSVHFGLDEKKGRSPYGCHMYPNLEYFPAIKMKSLPDEPLQKGEQYYSDLAGNIKKGPRGMGYMCYCAPFFKHVERKMDDNKNELLKHIDGRNDDLKEKISHLERRTHDQLFNLNQQMKESLAFERSDCCERMDRRLMRERLDIQNGQMNNIQALRSEVRSWIQPINGETAKNPPINCRSAPTCQVLDYPPLSRSKSADLLSETDSHMWSTDVTSNNNTSIQTSKTANFINYAKQRFYSNSKNNGARPKNADRPSPKTSRWRTKSQSNSISIRDSRSEGDLTSCHREQQDNLPVANAEPNTNLPMYRTDLGQPNRILSDTNSYHPTRAIDSPGALWNRSKNMNTELPRNGIPSRDQSNNNYRPPTNNCNGSLNHNAQFIRQQQLNSSPFPATQVSNTHIGSSANNVIYDTERISIQPNESSFV